MGRSFNDRGGGGRGGNRRGGHDRDEGGGHGGYDSGYGARPARQPLQWTEAERITQGGASAVISVAHSDGGGKLYSFTLGRSPNGDKPGSKFMTPKDIVDAQEVLTKVQHWIDADRAESNGNSKPRQAAGVTVTTVARPN